jgi:predicted short-subunit dehydrogenase-like oxidoreductase (DUF2520 family)
VGSALVRELPKAGVKLVAPPDAEAVFLAVPDRVVAEVAASLRARPAQLAVHLAGALSLKALAPARRRGSLHPLRAFARNAPEDFRGAAAGIAGSDAAARAQLAELARRLGMTPIAASETARSLYHAAAVLAAGAQVALFAEAVSAFRKATGATAARARAALLPLALGALQRGVITGPAVRGDAQTIAAHRKALRKRQRALYDLLTEAMLEHARGQRARHRP